MFARSARLATLLRSHMNGLIPFEKTIEQTTETMPPSPETVTAADRKRMASLRELLHLFDVQGFTQRL